MSRKSKKLLFLATTTAAIGGAMYVFRDKIKESKILENSDENPIKPYLDKGKELKDKAVTFAKEKKLEWDAKKADTNEIVDMDDFSDSIFEENHDREYRSIHITSPEEETNTNIDTNEVSTEEKEENTTKNDSSLSFES